MLETDILIVGGGPAGSIAAKYLSKSGIKNTLVQRNFDFKKPCGGGIRIDAFSEFEIDKSLIQKQVNTIALVYKTTKIEVDISDFPLAIVDRVTFDRHLREDAKSMGTTIYEATFVSLERFDEYIISKIMLNKEYIEIKSNYIIAADGVHSKVRKLVNGDNVSSGLTSYIDITSKEYSICEFHFGEEVAGRYYAWAFPHASGSNIGTLAEKNPIYLNNLLDNLKIKERSKPLGYSIPHFENNIFYKDRVYFVGDSASQVLPFTYEGIYYAMSSAKILAEVIANKQDTDEYEREWNKKHYNKFTTLRTLQYFFLRNNFTIWIMISLYKSKHIQREMVKYWLGKRDLDITIWFVFRMIKRLIVK